MRLLKVSLIALLIVSLAQGPAFAQRDGRRGNNGGGGGGGGGGRPGGGGGGGQHMGGGGGGRPGGGGGGGQHMGGGGGGGRPGGGMQGGGGGGGGKGGGGIPGGGGGKGGIPGGGGKGGPVIGGGGKGGPVIGGGGKGGPGSPGGGGGGKGGVPGGGGGKGGPVIGGGGKGGPGFPGGGGKGGIPGGGGGKGGPVIGGGGKGGPGGGGKGGFPGGGGKGGPVIGGGGKGGPGGGGGKGGFPGGGGKGGPVIGGGGKGGPGFPGGGKGGFPGGGGKGGFPGGVAGGGKGGNPWWTMKPPGAGNGFHHHHANHDHWHHGNWNNHWNNNNNWNRSWWNRPWTWIGGGIATGVVLANIPWSWGYYNYSNPYYTPVVVDDQPYIDYSQPILAQGDAGQPWVAASQPTDPNQGTPEEIAGGLLDEARQAFRDGAYSTALVKVDQAISNIPDDPALHEFRGLTLFAMGKYKEAAGVIYAVLSAGPGWDWETMIGLYPDVDIYTQQLRALEAYRKANPQEAETHFLSAYLYLASNFPDAAAKELREVVRLMPNDQLSAQLLASLDARGGDDQVPPDQVPELANPAGPAGPIDAASLAGGWKSSRPDGSGITLDLRPDSTFTWQFAQGGKTQEFNGNYKLADNLLVLSKDDNPIMAGQIRPTGDKSFNFKLMGSPAADPGLDFQQ